MLMKQNLHRLFSHDQKPQCRSAEQLSNQITLAEPDIVECM